MRLLIFNISILFLLTLGLSSGLGLAASKNSGWHEWLSTEDRMIPIVSVTVKLGNEGGLNAIINTMKTLMNSVRYDNLSDKERNELLAGIWVASIVAQLRQDVDPIPNKEYQNVINDGMNMSSEKLHIPDLKKCMELTVKTIIKVEQQMMNSR